MKFLRIEVKGAERLSYVREGLGEPVKEKSVKDRKVTSGHNGLPVLQQLGCLLVVKQHVSSVTSLMIVKHV